MSADKAPSSCTARVPHATHPPQIRTICVYCPDLAGRQAELARAFPDATFSHGCCRKCHRRLIDELIRSNHLPADIAQNPCGPHFIH